MAIISLSTECLVRVGQTLVVLQFADAQTATRLRRHLGVPFEEGVPDIRLSVQISGDCDSVVPDSLLRDKSVDGETFTIGGGIVRGDFHRDRAEGTIEVSAGLFKGRLIRVFEQLLYQAFYSDPRNGKGAAVLLHSSGVIRQGNGYLFTGPSGAGKSTIARLSRDDMVLNDEICLVRFSGEQAIVEGTPFNGFFKRKVAGEAPLKAIFVLSQGRAHSVAAMSPSQAVAALLPQIVPPIGLDERITRATLDCMMNLAQAVQEAVPVYSLKFKRDPGFWREIDLLQVSDRPGGLR
jgi:hypothetical protein